MAIDFIRTRYGIMSEVMEDAGTGPIAICKQNMSSRSASQLCRLGS